MTTPPASSVLAALTPASMEVVDRVGRAIADQRGETYAATPERRLQIITYLLAVSLTRGPDPIFRTNTVLKRYAQAESLTPAQGAALLDNQILRAWANFSPTEKKPPPGRSRRG